MAIDSAVGVWLTMRRLLDARLPLWFVALFFVPAANLIFFLAVALQDRGAFTSVRSICKADYGPAVRAVVAQLARRLNGDCP